MTAVLIAAGETTFGVSAAWAPPPWNPVPVPAHDEALSVFASIDHREIGHTFFFSWEISCTGNQADATLKEARLVERPRTKARPYEFALLHATGHVPARNEGPDYCSHPWQWRTASVITKRPVRRLTIFDTSDQPPVRIWPRPKPPPPLRDQLYRSQPGPISSTR
ncbi:MAG TPA: hypothetical protein VH476_08670 [Solirubrobacterales bacterium]